MHSSMPCSAATQPPAERLPALPPPPTPTPTADPDGRAGRPQDGGHHHRGGAVQRIPQGPRRLRPHDGILRAGEAGWRGFCGGELQCPGGGEGGKGGACRVAPVPAERAARWRGHAAIARRLASALTNTPPPPTPQPPPPPAASPGADRHPRAVHHRPGEARVACPAHGGRTLALAKPLLYAPPAGNAT